MIFQQLFNVIVANSPDFAKEIMGATVPEMEELTRLVGAAIPSDYQAFLKTMGRSSGRVRALRKNMLVGSDGKKKIEESEIDITVKSILNHYRRAEKNSKRMEKGKAALKKEAPNLEDFFLIGLDQRGNDNGHFYVDTTEDLLPVFELTETFGAIPRAPSFVEFLFADVFPREVRKFFATRIQSIG